MNPDHFARFAHPHLEELDEANPDTSISNAKRNMWKNQRKVMHELFGAPSKPAPTPSPPVKKARMSKSPPPSPKSKSPPSTPTSNKKVDPCSSPRPPSVKAKVDKEEVPQLTKEKRRNQFEQQNKRGTLESEGERSDNKVGRCFSPRSSPVKAKAAKKEEVTQSGSLKEAKKNRSEQQRSKETGKSGESRVSKAVTKNAASDNKKPVHPKAPSGAPPPSGKDRPRNDVRGKLERSAPLNLFYNKVRDSPETRDSDLSLYFADLLHPSLGSVKSSLQMTFMVELDWLMMNYEMTRNESKPLTVLYDKLGGVEDADGCDLTEKYPNITLQKIRPKYPFGTHHTKIMVIVYEDESVRVVVGTSNLLGDDWLNRSQGLWVSPKCPSIRSSGGDGDSTTNFKRDLVNYLERYELGSVLRPFIDSIQNCDMSQINAFFLASVPGSYDVSASGGPKYGQIGLESILRQHADESIKDWPVIMQCSSIGSLGKSPDGSFMEELATTLNACRGRTGAHRPAASGGINFVYPTVNDVIRGYGGAVYSSGCLPYTRSSHEKQPWLEEFMYVWKADSIHRTRAIPHVKSYTKIREKEAGYFVLTSSNLSKAAWGGYNKGRTKLFIKSHEAGVLLLPKFTHHGKPTYQLDKELVLPYDWPLTKYQKDKDRPFFHEA